MVDQPSRMRTVTVGRRILDVIADYHAVKREDGNLKYIKHEMLPPLTASFRQSRAIREVHRLQERLMKEMEKCDQDDIERQSMLIEVTKKCEALKSAFENSEGAIIQLQRQKETHKRVMDTITDETESSTRQIIRYVKATENLVAIRDIVQQIINENTCYLDFLEQVAAESARFKTAREITGRYEKLVAVKKILTERLDEALKRLEETKKQVLLYNFSADSKHHNALQRLQAVDYELNQVKSKTIKYEMALNNVSIESLEQMRTLNLVLKSAEQLIENLIKEKVINKKYRKKTLAQQFEAIRKNFLKKKAVLREYQKEMDKLKWKKSRRVKVFDGYEALLVQKLRSNKRMEDLMEKKKVLDWKKKEAEYIKKMRRLRSVIFEQFEDGQGKNKEESKGISIKRDANDEWEDDDEPDTDFDNLHQLGSDDESNISFLEDRPGKPEFIPTEHVYLTLSSGHKTSVTSRSSSH